MKRFVFVFSSVLLLCGRYMYILVLETCPSLFLYKSCADNFCTSILVTQAPSNPGSTVSSPKTVPKSPKSPRSPRGRPALKAIDMDVKGNKLTFYPPDSYNDNMVNTDPPQLRLKLEWV